MKKESEKLIYFKLRPPLREYKKSIANEGLIDLKDLMKVGVLFGSIFWVLQKIMSYVVAGIVFPFYLLTAPKIRFKKKKK